MKTLYVRINPKLTATCFWRCGIEFSQAWRPVIDIDDATAQRLEEEQMLEVTETRPAELDDVLAGDSAVAIVSAVELSVPPADAPEVVAVEAAPVEVVAPPSDALAAVAEVVAVEAAPAEAAAAETAPAKRTKVAK